MSLILQEVTKANKKNPTIKFNYNYIILIQQHKNDHAALESAESNKPEPEQVTKSYDGPVDLEGWTAPHVRCCGSSFGYGHH